MNALEESVKKALAAKGETPAANKAYLEFIKANFTVPIEKNDHEEPQVLFFKENDQAFLPVFTNMTMLENWAKDIKDDIVLLKLSGVDLLKGIGENVTVCLNIGSPDYKAFNPSEIARMRSMVLKLFKQWKESEPGFQIHLKPWLPHAFADYWDSFDQYQLSTNKGT